MYVCLVLCLSIFQLTNILDSKSLVLYTIKNYAETAIGIMGPVKWHSKEVALYLLTLPKILMK